MGLGIFVRSYGQQGTQFFDAAADDAAADDDDDDDDDTLLSSAMPAAQHQRDHDHDCSDGDSCDGGLEPDGDADDSDDSDGGVADEDDDDGGEVVIVRMLRSQDKLVLMRQVVLKVVMVAVVMMMMMMMMVTVLGMTVVMVRLMLRCNSSAFFPWPYCYSPGSLFALIKPKTLTPKPSLCCFAYCYHYDQCRSCVLTW